MKVNGPQIEGIGHFNEFTGSINLKYGHETNSGTDKQKSTVPEIKTVFQLMIFSLSKYTVFSMTKTSSPKYQVFSSILK